MNIHTKNFYINGSRVNKNNETMVQCRIHINKETFTQSTNISINPKFWDDKKKKVKGTSKQADLNNEKLNNLSYEIDFIVLQANKNREKLTAEILKNKLLNQEVTGHSVLELFDRYAKNKIDSRNRKGTIRNRQIRRKNLVQFLEYTFNSEDVIYDKMKSYHAEDFYKYLTNVKQVGHNHCSKIIMEVKAVFEYARKRELIDKNVFEMVNYSQIHTKEYEYLELEQLQMIEKYNFANPYLEKIKDCFLFQCYTGMSYEDLSTVKPEHIHIVPNEPKPIIFLEKIRGKSQDNMPKKFSVELSEEAQAIIEKYGGIDKLPIISNQKYNVYLKEIGNLVGIDFPLKTHTGRKTFGNIMINHKLYDASTVAVMMGDKLETVEKYYVKPNRNRVINEIKKKRLGQ